MLEPVSQAAFAHGLFCVALTWDNSQESIRDIYELRGKDIYASPRLLNLRRCDCHNCDVISRRNADLHDAMLVSGAKEAPKKWDLAYPTFWDQLVHTLNLCRSLDSLGLLEQRLFRLVQDRAVGIQLENHKLHVR